MNAPATLTPVGDGLKREKLQVDVAAVLANASDGFMAHLEDELPFLPPDEQPIIREAIRRERLHRRLKPAPVKRTVANAVKLLGDAMHARRAREYRGARPPYRDE